MAEIAVGILVYLLLSWGGRLEAFRTVVTM